MPSVTPHLDPWAPPFPQPPGSAEAAQQAEAVIAEQQAAKPKKGKKR